MADLAAICGRRFGENRDLVAVAQSSADVADQRFGLVPTPSDEKSAVTARKPADEWPASHLGLGQETHVGSGSEHQDVQPGHVVAHDEGLPPAHHPTGMHLDAGELQRAPVPGAAAPTQFFVGAVV
jgi:hypothetical protein